MLIPIILSGGAGTRLWPVSRELHPKPFMRLSDGKSLLQKTFDRAAALPDVVEIMTVTNRDFLFKTVDEYGAVNRQNLPISFILEPFGRNTAPAIAAAIFQSIEKYGPGVTLLILSADHIIADGDGFSRAVERAVNLASKNFLVTFGVRPDTPETGYGYIEFDGHHVKRFVEKPPFEKAEEYVSSGNYLWNAGIFCFLAEAALKELEVHCADVSAAVRLCLDVARRSEGENFSQVDLGADLFRQVPDISIDYALMEKSSRVAVVACDIGWSDVGSWNAIGDLFSADDNGNRVQGDVFLHDVSNCYVQSDGRVIGAVGVRDLLIIDTPDALLVADRNRAQDVRQVVGQLKQTGHDAYKIHRTVHRPWGTYSVLEEGNHFKIKRIEVRPGASLSLQMHYHRSEHWIVVSGMAKVTNGDHEIFIRTNESTFIPAGCRHRLENPGKVDLIMIEVQSGEYLGEDDIVRFSDHYGRADDFSTRST